MLRLALLLFITLDAGIFFTDARASDVKFLQQLQMQSLNTVAAAGVVDEQDNVTIVEYAGNFERGNNAARQQVTANFYQTHADDFDFLVFFTTFDIETEAALGFYTGVRNDVQGIGIPVADNSTYFGSQGRLQGLIDMARVTDATLDPLSPAFQQKLTVLAHEVMHRWCCYIDYQHNGQLDTSLRGHDGVHWSYFLGTDASVMYGSDWKETTAGQFDALAVMKVYSPLDLYLAGFYASQEVPDFLLIRDAPGDATSPPIFPDHFSGRSELISLGQVTAQAGSRIPDVVAAQKTFRATFILIKRPGEQLSPGLLPGMETLRREFQERFSLLTRGRGRIDIHPDVLGASTTGLPHPLVGSAPIGQPANVLKAMAWLDARQLASGAWQDKETTTTRDTASAISTLSELGDNVADLAQARSWLTLHNVANLDDDAQRVRIDPQDRTAINALSAAQNADGGWGMTAMHSSSPFDTALILDSLPPNTDLKSVRDAGTAYLRAVQNADGSFGTPEHGFGRIVTTARSVQQLQLSDGTCNAACVAAKQWLVSQQLKQGGFGDSSATALETAEALLALGRIDSAEPGVIAAKNYLGQLQGSAGDWSGSVHTTARAVLALARLALPNLYVRGSPSAVPAAANDGERVSLIAVVSNSGSQMSGVALARWYDGRPDQGGTQIGVDIPIPPLLAGVNWPIAVAWDTHGAAGAHDLWLVVDATDVVAEINENDNAAELHVTVAPASSQPDLAVYSADLQITPPAISQLPTTIHISGQLWNLGVQDVVVAHIALATIVDGATTIVSRQALVVPARSSADFSFDYAIVQEGAVSLALIADPDNEISEASKDNNRAEITLGVQAAIDLEVTNADLRLDTSNPTTGRDALFHIILRNRGTSVAAVTRLVTSINDGSAALIIDDQQVQLNAGASTEREISWHAPTTGSHQLVVEIDPDHLIAETDESNNKAMLAFAVVAARGSNLSLAESDIAFAPDPPLQGAHLDVHVTVHNTGADSAPAFLLALYDGDPRANGSLLSRVPVPDGLVAGSSTIANIHVDDLPFHGDHSLYAYADSDNVVAEQDETDNLAFRSTHIPSLPDLSVVSGDVFVTPSNPIAGQPATVRATVRNLGEQEASNFTVQLFESTSQSGTAVVPSQTIESIPGHSSQNVDFSWTFGVAPGADRLSLVIDPTNTIRETEKSNNVASFPLNVQDGQIFVTERYISPNGDGVQDSSTIVVRGDVGAYARMDIVNVSNETVRSFSIQTISTEGGQAAWDGRDQDGRIVSDGDYSVELDQADGVLISKTLVTVDNNHSELAEAIGTVFEYDHVMGFRDNSTQLAYTTNAGGPAFLVWDPYEISTGQSRVGVYRSTLGNDLAAVVTAEWLSQHGFSNASVSDVSQDHSNSIVVFNGVSQTPSLPMCAVGVAEIDNVDHVRVLVSSTQLANLCDYLGGDGPKFGGEKYIYLIDSQSDGQGNHSNLLFINLIDGSSRSVLDIADLASRENLIGSSTQGLIFKLASSVILFEPFSPDRTAVQWNLQFGTQINSNEDVFVRGNYVIERLAGHLSIDDAATGQQIRQYAYTYVISPYVDDIRTFPLIYGDTDTDLHSIPVDVSPDGKYIVIAANNPQGAALTMIDIVSGTERTFSLPALNDPHRLALAHSICDPKGLSILIAPSIFSSGHEVGYYRDHTISNGSLTWNWKNSHFAIGILDQIMCWSDTPIQGSSFLSDYTISGRLLNVDMATGTVTEIAHRSHGPFDDASSNPDVGFFNGNLLEKDRSFLFYDDIDLGLNSFPFEVARDDIGIYQGDNSKGYPQIISSLLNLSAHIEAIDLGSSFLLQGIAADRNFASYQIEWAAEDAPDEWQSVTGPTPNPVINDQFMVWSPPASGNLLVRLRVIDKAGNQTSDTTRIVAAAPAAIDRLGIAPRYISPNGDGVQDVASISFNVLMPTSFAIVVVDSKGVLAHHAIRQYGIADLGAHIEVWDGRDDQGNIVPDGLYTIEIATMQFKVVVDTTLPRLFTAIVDPYQKLVSVVSPLSSMSFTVSESNIDSADIEFSLGGQSDPWYVFKHYPTGALSGLAMDIPDPVYLHSPADYFRYQFRLTVHDKAGNQTRAAFVKPQVNDGRLIFAAWHTNTNGTALQQLLDSIRQLPYQERPFSAANIPGFVELPGVFAASDPLVFAVLDAVPERVQQLWVETRVGDDPNWKATAVDWSVALADASRATRISVPFSTLFHDSISSVSVRVGAVSTTGETLYSNAAAFSLKQNPNGGPGVIQPPPIPPGTSNTQALDIRISPLAAGTCGAPPTSRVLLEVQPSASTSAMTHLGASYIDPLTGVEQTLLDVDNPHSVGEGQCAYPYYDVLDLTHLPEGQIVITLRAEFADGTRSQLLNVPVDHTLPVAAITAPADGGRVCVDTSVKPLHIPIIGTATDQAGFGYRLEYSKPATPDAWHLIKSDGFSTTEPSCYSQIARVRDLTLHDVSALGDLLDLDSSSTNTLASYNGALALRLTAMDWSGAQVCTSNQVYFDTIVDADLRGIEPLLSSHTGPARAGLSLATGSTNTIMHLAVATNEPIVADVEIHSVAFDEGANWSAGDDVLELAQSGVLVNQVGDLTWDGRLQGHAAPDGDYAIVVVLHDSCTHVERLVRFITVDSTPPSITISAPLPSAQTSGAMLSVVGSAEDANFDHYALDISADGANWQSIGTGNMPVSPANLLGRWNANAAAGNFTLRLQATDRLGNHSTLLVPIVQMPSAGLLNGIALQPTVISPNSDGQFDQASIVLTLGRSAILSVTVIDSVGHVVATLANAALRDVGAQVLLWNGRTDAGLLAADGDYLIHVQASDPNNSAITDQSQIGISIDTAQPLLQLLSPIGAYSSGTGSARFQVSDVHLVSVHAKLSGGNSASPINIEFSEAQSGTFDLATLANLAEGSYQLALDASDIAANVSHSNAQFILDRTLPVSVISSPVDHQVLARGATVNISGTASDDNFEHYELDYSARSAPSDWTLLATSPTSIHTDVLLSWKPTLVDGDYVLRLRAFDDAGNTKIATIGISIDGTAPIVQITAPVDGANVQGNFPVVGTAKDAHLIEYRLSIATPQQVAQNQWSDITSGNHSVDNGTLGQVQLALADGNYVLRLSAKDAAGLASSTQVKLRLDRTPPPPPNTLVAKVLQHRDVQLNWTDVIADDLAGYYVYRGGARLNMTPIAAPSYLDATAPEGVLSYQISALDLSGNESELSAPATAVIDHTPPVTVIASPSSGTRVRGVLVINGVAYSNEDFKDYRLSAQQTSPVGSNVPISQSTLPVQFGRLGQWDTSGLIIETHVQISLSAEDINGNSATNSVDVIVDNDPPSAPSGLTAVLVNANVQLNWNANTESDLLGYLLYRNGQLIGWKNNLPSDLRAAAIKAIGLVDTDVPDGPMVYTVYAIDQAGNVSPPSAPAALTLDQRAPEIQIVAPTDGYSIAQTVHVIARSNDLDIANVQFSYRPVAGGSWTSLGEAMSHIPYETFWTPGPLPRGAYLIRAIAVDQTGLSTTTPPTVQVHYPPPPVASLGAKVDGATVHLIWSATSVAGIASFTATRTSSRGDVQQLTSIPSTATTFDDSGLSDGTYIYRVAAVDQNGSPGIASDAVAARVFSVQLDQPYTPTSEANVRVSGTSPATGQILISAGTQAVGASDNAGSTDAGGVIVVEQVALARGDNTITVRIADGTGNFSKPAAVIVSHDIAPSVPSGLSANATDHHVDIQWDANAEDNILGYRVFRRGHSAQPDAPLTQTITAFAASGNYSAAIDADSTTGWNVYPVAGAGYVPLELNWPTPAIVTALHLNWGAANTAASAYAIEAWNQIASAWIPLSTIAGNATTNSVVTFAQPYRTNRLRILPIAGSTTGSGIELNEVIVTERPLVSANTYMDDVIDGNYDYTVTAVNALAFESAQCSPVDVAIGDTTPPDAVVLIASVADSNVQLNWTPSIAADVAIYRIYRDGSEWKTLASTITSYLDKNVANGHHAYAVIAIDNFGNASTPSNTVSVDISASMLGAPEDLAVSAPLRGGALDISWQPAVGPTPASYILYRGNTAAGPFAINAQTAATGVRDEPVLNNNVYYYSVVALDAAGNLGARSATVSGVPRDAQPPPPPRLYLPTVPERPLLINASSIDVIGAAEPGAWVDLLINGVKVDRQQSLQAAFKDGLTIPYEANFSVSPEGRRAWIGDALIDLVDGSQTQLSNVVSSIAWSADGQSFFSADGHAVSRYDIATNQWQVLALGIDQPRFAYPAPDGSYLLVAGLSQEAGVPLSALWLVDPNNAAPARHLNIDPDSLCSDPVWSPDGSRIAICTDDSLWIVRLTDLSHSIAMNQTLDNPAWSSDSSAVVASRNDDTTARAQLAVYTLASQALTLFAPSGVAQRNPAFSPDGRMLAFSSEGQAIQVHAWPTVELLASYPQAAAETFAWSTPARLVARESQAIERIDLPGFVQFHSAPLAAGANLLLAQATDASGNLSLPSLPLMITRPTAGLPDLTVSDTDIRFVPALGQVGQDYSASITIANAGDVVSSNVDVRLILAAPDGSSQNITAPMLEPISAGASRVVAVDLGTLTQSGHYQLSVSVDPQNALTEKNENNNTALAVLVLTANGAPLLELAPSQTVFAPGVDVTGLVAVTGAGREFAGSVVVSIEDVEGNVIAVLSNDAIAGLGNAQRWSQSTRWTPAADTLAGVYQMRAVLRDIHASVTSERFAAFSIDTFSHLQLSAVAAKNVYAPGTAATINVSMNYFSGNAVLGAARLILSAADGNGSEVFRWQRELGDLLPGYRAQIPALWNLSADANGTYALTLTLQAENGNYSTSGSVQVVQPAPRVAVAGSIALKTPPLVLGRAVVASYQVSNLGQLAIDNLAVRARLIDVSGSTQIANSQTLVSLAVGASTSLDVDLTPASLGFGDYLLVLEAQVPDVPGGGWSLLAQCGAEAVDLLPPTLAILAPQPASIARTPVAVLISAIDANSRIDRVETSVDGGSWGITTLQADGKYIVSLTGLADGVHVLSVRAKDVWGNQAIASGQSFVVDNSAPLITISGVADGESSSHQLIPVIGIADANPSTSTVTLNGAAFESATTISAQGNYLLRVTATDSAGNTSTKTVYFSIDLSAPTLSILSPAQGATIGQDHVDVIVQSEGGAGVEIERGIYRASGFTGVDGLHTFVTVPLDPGSNLVRARATDAAGNVGAWVSIQVTRPTDNGNGVSATLTVSGNQVAVGDTLNFAYVVTNDTRQPLVMVPMRLRTVQTSTNDQIASDLFSLDLPAHGTSTGQLSHATHAWALGAYIAIIEADLSAFGGAAGWTVLDSVHLSIVDGTPPQLTVLTPDVSSYHSGSLLISVRSQDALSAIAIVQARVDNNDWFVLNLVGAANYQDLVPSLTDGPHALDVRSIDTAGNTGEIDGIGFFIDNLPPLINITGVADGERTVQDVTPTIGVADASPITLTLVLDGAPFVSGTAVSSEGNHILTVGAVDAAGNHSTRAVHFSIDHTGPTVTITAPLNATVTSQNPIHLIGQSEANVGVDILVGGYSAHVLTDTFGHFDAAAVPLVSGGNVITVHATDDLGNSGASASVNVTYSPATSASVTGQLSIAPALIVFGDSFNANYSIRNTGLADLSALPLRVKVTSLATQQPLAQQDSNIQVTAGAHSSGTAVFAAIGWAVGDYQVTLLASLLDENDTPQWITLDTQTLRVADTSPPQVLVLTPLPDAYARDNLLVQASAIDTLSGVTRVEVQIDTGSWQTLTLTAIANVYGVDLVQLAQGNHSLHVRAFDSWNNVAVSDAVVFHIDSTSPAITVAGIEDGGIYNHEVAASVSVVDSSPITVKILLDGTDYLSNVPIVAQGAHYLSVHATDASGNQAQTDVHFSIDSIPPSIRITAPRDGDSIENATTDVLGITEAQASVELMTGSLTSQVQADAIGVFVVRGLRLQLGNNIIAVRATDQAGNASDWSQIMLIRNVAVSTCTSIVGRIFADGFDGLYSLLDEIFCNDFEPVETSIQSTTKEFPLRVAAYSLRQRLVHAIRSAPFVADFAQLADAIQLASRPPKAPLADTHFGLSPFFHQGATQADERPILSAAQQDERGSFVTVDCCQEGNSL